MTSGQKENLKDERQVSGELLDEAPVYYPRRDKRHGGDTSDNAPKNSRKIDDDTLSEIEGAHNHARRPWWVLFFICLAAAIAAVVWSFINQQNYRISCEDHRISLLRGRGLPLPYGYNEVSSLPPIQLGAKQTTCPASIYKSQLAAEGAIVDFVLNNIKTALAQPYATDWTLIRKQLNSISALVERSQFHGRKADLDAVWGDLAYREGRFSIERIEAELRYAIDRFTEAHKRAASHYPDAIEWSRQLEQMLKQVSPAPTTQRPPQPGQNATSNEEDAEVSL